MTRKYLCLSVYFVGLGIRNYLRVQNVNGLNTALVNVNKVIEIYKGNCVPPMIAFRKIETNIHNSSMTHD